MNKFLSKVITVAMAMLLVFSICIQVKADNNWTDTYDTAVLDDANGITEFYTTGRYKADTSKGYVMNIRSSYSEETRFSLVASDGDGSSNHYENFTLYPQDVPPGEYAFLTSFVKENGYNYAAVKVEPGSDHYMETYFAWSPDNYNGY